MAVEKAPYVNYTEISSYMDTISNGSEIPVFVVKTNNTVSVDDITESKVLTFKTYSQFKQKFAIPNDEVEYDALSESMKELDTIVKDFFVENSMYGESNTYGLTVPYIYMIDVGNAPTIAHYKKASSVSEIKRNSTVLLFPNVEDVDFMNELDVQVKQETKSGLLRIAYFGVSGQGEITDKFKIGSILKPKTVVEGITEVIEGYKNENKFYEESEHTTELTPKTTALYLDKHENKAYKYADNTFTFVATNTIANKLVYQSEDEYKLLIPSTSSEAMGGANETFDEFCIRLSNISENVQSSRVGIVEKEHYGKTIARICSTPYHVEPGYLPYMSVKQGVFKQRSLEDRDALCMTGLIFNEDDYTLSQITPRICLTSSTAWGIEDKDYRVTDSLIHARRNVDHHIRNIFKIIAPQLKRNETSVTIRYVKNQIDMYLDKELSKGTIMEYSFDVKESSYNPYTLLIRGKITPVNCTLGIEFENRVGSPYAIASDYV